MSIAETNPYTGYERRYVHKHVHLWEASNGPVPKDHCLKCVDGDRKNTSPDNWIAVPRSVIPRLNGGARKTTIAYDAAPVELKPTLLATALLEHKVRTVGRSAKANPSRTDRGGVSQTTTARGVEV